MPDNKTIIGIIAIILTFVGYVPYVKDVVQGKTTPHVYTWFIWGLVTAIAYALQVSAGAGVGSWVTLAVAIICFFILILGLTRKRDRDEITKSDTTFFVLSLVALGLWLIAKQPILSVILISSIDMLGFAPTIRKSWNKPYSETLFSYELNVVRHGLSIFALQQYNIVTWLYPASWVLANAIFSLILIVRRQQIDNYLTTYLSVS